MNESMDESRWIFWFIAILLFLFLLPLFFLFAIIECLPATDTRSSNTNTYMHTCTPIDISMCVCVYVSIYTTQCLVLSSCMRVPFHSPIGFFFRFYRFSRFTFRFRFYFGCLRIAHLLQDLQFFFLSFCLLHLLRSTSLLISVSLFLAKSQKSFEFHLSKVWMPRKGVKRR